MSSRPGGGDPAGYYADFGGFLLAGRDEIADG